jgi:hypothetical protein
MSYSKPRYVEIGLVEAVVVFTLDLADLTTCSAMRGVPAHAMLEIKVNIQI